MSDLIGIVIMLTLTVGYAVLCYRELEKICRNPLPKFYDSDKRFCEVKMIKTRNII